MADTVALIDDDPDLSDAVRMLLASHGYEVRAYSSASDFLETFVPAGCIICDIRMPGISGMDLLTRLKERQDPRPFIMLTAHGDVAMATRAIKLGAFDFIEKPFANEHLVETVRQAIAEHLTRESERVELQALQERYHSLTQRQRETMDLLVQGKATKEIANDLDISPRTVEAYRAWVMTKMNAKSVADLVRMAMRIEEGR